MRLTTTTGTFDGQPDWQPIPPPPPPPPPEEPCLIDLPVLGGDLRVEAGALGCLLRL